LKCKKLGAVAVFRFRDFLLLTQAMLACDPAATPAEPEDSDSHISIREAAG